MARPALAALQEQQTVIQGIQTTAQRVTAQHRTAFNQLRQANIQLAARLDTVLQQNRQLALGLRAVARAAGIEEHVAAAMFRTADVQNPAQPIPEPPSEPAFQSTQEAKTPEAMADVQTPGMVGGSTQDVAADLTSTVYTPGQDVDAPPLKNLIDVTRPVDGTQSPRPLSEVRTETEVRNGNPMNPQVAFPLRGDFQQGQRLQTGASVDASNRTMAALRLAKLRIATRTADSGNDIEVATGIERDASLSTEAIENEIRTLENVRTASARQRPANNPASRGLVPRTAAGVQRTVPSMQGGNGQGHTAGLAPTSLDFEVTDADLFD